MTFPCDTSISPIVERFQDENQGLALVSEEPGADIVGLVTATDTFEAILGEIEDPPDIQLRE